jgi:hypothetical protein
VFGVLQVDVQAAQQEQAAVEDSNSRVTFEVEVVHFQAYLQAELAPGRFLLAAEKGRVQGRSMPHLFQSLITLTLDQVSSKCFNSTHSATLNTSVSYTYSVYWCTSSLLWSGQATQLCIKGNPGPDQISSRH